MLVLAAGVALLPGLIETAWNAAEKAVTSGIAF
jgi:hypothetical protein